MAGFGGIDAVVLAGGLGTRLKSVLPDRPKVLAPVGGRPFIDRLLEQLAALGCGRAVLALGHLAEQVEAHLAANPPPLPVVCSVEPEPLGTLGAVALARPHLTTDPVLVMNGDTIVDVDADAFLAAHRAGGAPATIAAVQVPDSGRFGGLALSDDDAITAFKEKSADAGPGWISAGVYLLTSPLLDRVAALGRGSLEVDLFQALPPGSLRAWRASGRFIDYGTPQSFAEVDSVVQPDQES